MSGKDYSANHKQDIVFNENEFFLFLTKGLAGSNNMILFLSSYTIKRKFINYVAEIVTGPSQKES